MQCFDKAWFDAIQWFQRQDILHIRVEKSSNTENKIENKGRLSLMRLFNISFIIITVVVFNTNTVLLHYCITDTTIIINT